MAATVLVGAIVLAGCGGAGDRAKPPTEPASIEKSVRIELAHFDEPAGTASLEPIDNDRTRVVVISRRLARGRVDIHQGGCLELGLPVLYTVGPLVDGRADVELDVSITELTSRASALWVHATADEEDSVACGEFGESKPQPTVWSPRRAAEMAACIEPVSGYGFEEGQCARLERVERVSDGVWRLQLRRPPLYCVELARLEDPKQPSPTDFDGVGRLTEVRCPASAYPAAPEPDLQAQLRSPISDRLYGSVSLTAVSPAQTRVLVEAEMDVAEIHSGRCGSQPTRPRFELDDFYSFRSVTVLQVPLRSLTATPHAVYVDAGGAHGGEPLACADLSEPLGGAR